jgi:hypothetical protein
MIDVFVFGPKIELKMAIEMVVSSSTQRGSYTSLSGSNPQTAHRQIAIGVAIIALGVCALLAIVGNANFTPEDSVMNALSLSVRSDRLDVCCKLKNTFLFKFCAHILCFTEHLRFVALG